MVIIRVELHGYTTETIYLRLHAALAAIGFDRTVDVDQQTQALPHGTYFSIRYAEPNAALIAAWNASTGVWNDVSIVAGGNDVRVKGLKRA